MVTLERNTDGTYFIFFADYGTLAKGLSLENGRHFLRDLSRARFVDTTPQPLRSSSGKGPEQFPILNREEA
jgi:hypothetical protein